MPTRLAALVERRKDLERQLLAKSEAYRTYQAKAKLTGDDIRAALPAGCVLIDLREYGHIAPPIR